MIRFTSSVLAVFLLNFTFAITATADQLPLPDQPHIIVNGYGYIDQIPDQATVRFEVTVTAADFSTAKKEVDAIVAKAIRAAKKQKVDDDNINASKINAAPQYQWNNKIRVYTGERVSRQVQVKLTEIERYNKLVEGILSSGVTRLQSVQLDFSKRAQLEMKALTLALDNAKNKAKIMANHLGEKLAGVFQIAPIGATPVVTHMAMRANRESQSDGGALKPGKQKIQQQVRVVYLLGH